MFEHIEFHYLEVEHACLQAIQMENRIRAKEQKMKLGVPIGPFGPKPLDASSSGHPAFGWELSDKAKRDIERYRRD
jgi:hypothetical protein